MSTLQVNTIRSTASTTPPIFQTSTGTQIGTLCRAWVVFNGIGSISIDASFNVSTITDLGVGAYRVTFTTPMPDADYAFAGSCTTDGVTFNGFTIATATGASKTVNFTGISVLAPATGSNVASAGGFAFDPIEVNAAFFR